MLCVLIRIAGESSEYIQYTVKPAYVVTYIKGSLALSSHIFWFP